MILQHRNSQKGQAFKQAANTWIQCFKILDNWFEKNWFEKQFYCYVSTIVSCLRARSYLIFKCWYSHADGACTVSCGGAAAPFCQILRGWNKNTQ